jgi:hypothetical protein
MEADWSVEIGADLPTIAVPWEGFIDLRCDPSAAYKLPETKAVPALAQSLIRLNQESSPVFTSKCDFWQLSADEIDPLEFDAAQEDTKTGIACYIDIITRNQTLFTSFPLHEAWARTATDEMRKVPIRKARSELVIRPAIMHENEGYALSLYVASCGHTEAAAHSIFSSTLEAAATITMKQAATAGE